MEGAFTRRTFLKQTGLMGLVTILPLKKQELVIRPPGATRDFASRCISCGKCLEACPYDSVRFLDITSGALIHTPYVDPLITPCYLCQERGPDGKDRPLSKYLLCGDACPTGAIRKIVNEKEVLAEVPDDMKMGVSVLNRKLCLAWEYDSCGECYYNCPLKDKALKDRPPDIEIEVATGIRPYVDANHCIGCGMCNYVCPVKKHIAEAVMKRDVKLTHFEARYAAMVRNLIGRAGPDVRLPAVRVTRIY
jgi:ferredoxin-type protein NapG